MALNLKTNTDSKTGEVTVSGVSPRGVFKYPHLIEPDYGTTEFPIPDGVLNCRLVVDEETKDEFLEALAPIIEYAEQSAQEGFAKLKPAAKKKLGDVQWNEVFTPIYDEDTEEETGEFEFRFKTKASGVNPKTKKRWERKIPIFDAKGKPDKSIKQIWGGTEGKLGFLARAYFIPATGAAGVTFYLEAAQVIELVAGGTNRTAESFGFGEEEGGYEADDLPFEAEEGSYESTEDDGDDDF